MKVAKSLIASLALVVASLAPVAQATVINFNDMTGAGTIVSYGAGTMTTGGFTFKGTAPSYVIGSDYLGNSDSGSTPYNATDFYLTYSAMTLASASPFKLNSIDLASWNYSGSGLTATFTGSKAGGGTVTQTLTGFGALSNASKVTGNDFTNYMLVGFDNLNSVTITHNFSAYMAMDNLVVNATSVPEPSSLTLFGLAIAAGAFARRRAGKAA